MNKYAMALFGILSVALIFLGNSYLLAHVAYMQTLKNYNRLSDEYNLLLAACNSTNIAFGWIDSPLGHKMIPSMDEVGLWLQNDTTDEYEYDNPDFDCFHYAVTLKLHGRAQHYDIGVIALYGYEYRPAGGEWFHCINAIVSSDGLVYIEPQVDVLWHLEGFSEIIGGNVYDFPGFGPIYVKEVKIIFDY